MSTVSHTDAPEKHARRIIMTPIGLAMGKPPPPPLRRSPSHAACVSSMGRNVGEEGRNGETQEVKGGQKMMAGSSKI